MNSTKFLRAPTSDCCYLSMLSIYLPKKDRLLQARQGQQRENGSTVEAKVTESLIATNLKAYLKEEKL